MDRMEFLFSYLFLYLYIYIYVTKINSNVKISESNYSVFKIAKLKIINKILKNSHITPFQFKCFM